ncbi:MAG: hypothetical protein GY788_07655 [bacterium]|nr:hypothetical protein [bacterium]
MTAELNLVERSELVELALLEASMRADGAVQTVDLLLALMDLDAVSWSVAALHIGTADQLRTARRPDPIGPGEEYWATGMTAATATSCRYAEALCVDYGLGTVDAGLLSLALLFDPAAGTNRTIEAASGADYSRALGIVVEHVLDLELEAGRFWPPWVSERLPDEGPGDGTADDLDALRVRAAVFADGKSLSSVHLLCAIALHSRGWLRDGLETLSLDHWLLRDPEVVLQQDFADSSAEPTIDRASDLARESEARAVDVAVAALTEPSPAATKWCAHAGIEPGEAVAQLRLADLAHAGIAPKPPMRTVGCSVMVLLLSLVTAGLAFGVMLSEGGWWRLPLLYLVFVGYPSGSPRYEVGLALFYGIVFSPLVGVVQLGSAAMTMLLAVIQRNDVAAQLGVRLTLRRSRFVVQRSNRRAVRFRRFRQERRLMASVGATDP